MPQGEQRPYGRRFTGAFRVPQVWLVAGVFLAGRVAVGLALGSSLGGLLRYAAMITVPTVIAGVAVVTTFMDPHAEWVGRGRPWRSAASFAVGTVAVAVAGAVLVGRTL